MSIQSINARNQFRGKIKEIILGPVVSEVDVDTPAGIVTSVITTRSVKELTCRWAPRCWLRQGHRGVGRRFDAGPQPCSGFMWRPRHAAARSGLAGGCCDSATAAGDCFQTLRRRFLSCRYAKMSGTGIGARSPLPDLEIESHAFVRCALFGAGMALSAAAASAPSSS